MDKNKNTITIDCIYAIIYEIKNNYYLICTYEKCYKTVNPDTCKNCPYKKSEV